MRPGTSAIKYNTRYIVFSTREEQNVNNNDMLTNNIILTNSIGNTSKQVKF